MEVEIIDNISIITQKTVTTTSLVNTINQNYDSYKDNHIIIDISNLKHITLDDIIMFIGLNNTHRAAKKSFVIITNSIAIDEIPDEIAIVPTLQEAYDIIEMETIERDLGF